MAPARGRAQVVEGVDPTTRPFSIRAATVEDVEAVAAIEASAFSNPWHPHAFRSLIAQGRAHILLAQGPDSEVLGYAVVWWVHEQGELANLAVREKHQRRGIGSALLDRILEDLLAQKVESLFLEVRASNLGALELYLSRGFTQISVRKEYYRKPREDARILLKQLGEAALE
jgi:ribosomal-protein-alanine N-acetyltransferase